MDLWVVAAATGAGYLAKYWQQLTSKEREENLLESSSGNLVSGQFGPLNLLWEFQDQTNPLHRHSWKEVGRDFPLGREDFAASGMASTSGSNIERDENHNVLSLTSLLPVFESNGFLQETGSTSSLQMNPRSRNIRYRSRGRGYYVRPVNSLESCLMAQLYKENAKMEEYIYSSFQSPSNPAVRPLLVTDGRQIISRASRDFRGQMQIEEGEMPLGGARRSSNLGLSRKPRLSTHMARSRRMSSYGSRVSFQSQQSSFTGSSNWMLTFFLGIATGIIFSSIANRREADNFKKMLEQTKNLAQDLHEELEMKDSLTVRELNYEDSAFLSDDCKSEEELYDQNEEKSESMSKIEAELEAELERLALSMNSSNFEQHITHEELKLGDAKSYSNQDLSRGSSNHAHDANYAVSPWELSFRLHEVIQSRLKARIVELERALESSQKRVHVMESERKVVQRSDYSETESSTQSPLFMEENDDNADQPLLLNLSGEALAAYNEAYEEICNMDMGSSRGDDSVPEHDNSKDKWLVNMTQDKNKISKERRPRNWGLNDLEQSEDEDENDDDEEIGQLLIKQIVEKARQGSHALLDAQRMLDSIDNQ